MQRTHMPRTTTTWTRVGGVLTAAGLLAGAASFSSAAQAAGEYEPSWSVAEERLTDNLGDQYDPSISGDIVVYTDYRSYDTDVWAYDVSTGSEFPVVVAPGAQELSDVSGDTIVYTDLETFDVVTYSISTGRSTNLTASAGSISLNPAVGGELVAWEDKRDGNLEIYARDLATGEERRLSEAPGSDARPAVSGRRVVWERCTGYDCDIFLYDWASGATTQVTATPGEEHRPDIDAGLVVYEALRDGERDIYAYDIDTGVETRLSLEAEQMNPNVSGAWVSLMDLRSGAYHVTLWNPSSGALVPLTGAYAGQQFLNDISGDRVVYTDDRHGQLDVYLSRFSVSAPAEYDFSGFAAPVDSDPSAVNGVKAGSAVPLKFTLGGDFGLDVLAGPVTVSPYACDPGDVVTPTETTAATRSGLRYDADAGQYVFVWKTDAAMAGTCQRLKLTFSDGTVGSAQFKLG